MGRGGAHDGKAVRVLCNREQLSAVIQLNKWLWWWWCRLSILLHVLN
jgi:hypothetical protein